MGREAEKYFALGERIVGIALNGSVLSIRPSESIPNVADADQLIVGDFLKRFLEDPLAVDLLPSESNVAVNLSQVFGLSALYGRQSMLGPRLEWRQCDLEGEALSVRLRAAAGRDFALTVGPDLEVLSASLDGRALPVLFSTNRRTDVLRRWPMNWVELPSGNANKIPFLSCRREFVQPGTETMEDPLPLVVRALVSVDEGGLWFVPETSKSAAIGGRLLSASVGPAGELSLFTVPRARIPISAESRRVFQTEVARFEAEFEANGRQLKPDVRIGLSSLFAGRLGTPVAAEFALRDVLVRENQFVVFLNSGQPDRYLEIVLSPDGSVLSSSVLDGLALSRAGGTPKLSTELGK